MGCAIFHDLHSLMEITVRRTLRLYKLKWIKGLFTSQTRATTCGCVAMASMKTSIISSDFCVRCRQSIQNIYFLLLPTTSLATDDRGICIKCSWCHHFCQPYHLLNVYASFTYLEIISRMSRLILRHTYWQYCPPIFGYFCWLFL